MVVVVVVLAPAHDAFWGSPILVTVPSLSMAFWSDFGIGTRWHKA